MIFKYSLISLCVVQVFCQILELNEAFDLFDEQNNSFLSSPSFTISNSEVDVEHYFGISGLIINETKETFIFNGKLSFNNYLCWNNDINERTVFNIGSITKFFSSALVLQLVDSIPELFPEDLNTKLSFYLPYLKSTYPKYDFVENLEKRDQFPMLTLLNLLQHTSGIGNFEIIDYNPYNDPALKDENKMMNQELNDAVYGAYKYSNLGYNLVGMIIRAVTNETISKLMKKYVLKPMNLTETLTFEDLIKTDKEIKLAQNNLELRVAQSYGYFDGTVKASQNIEFDSTTGGMYASLKDLIKFTKIYFSNEFWNQKQIKLRDTNPVVTDLYNASYGIGYFIYSNGEKGHSGTFMGAKSKVTYNQSSGVVKALTIISEGLTNKVSDMILAKGNASAVPNSLTLEYLERRTEVIEYLRSSYSISKLNSMLRVIHLNSKTFWDMYISNLWRAKLIC